MTTFSINPADYFFAVAYDDYASGEASDLERTAFYFVPVEHWDETKSLLDMEDLPIADLPLLTDAGLILEDEGYFVAEEGKFTDVDGFVNWLVEQGFKYNPDILEEDEPSLLPKRATDNVDLADLLLKSLF